MKKTQSNLTSFPQDSLKTESCGDFRWMTLKQRDSFAREYSWKSLITSIKFTSFWGHSCSWKMRESKTVCCALLYLSPIFIGNVTFKTQQNKTFDKRQKEEGFTNWEPFVISCQFFGLGWHRKRWLIVFVCDRNLKWYYGKFDLSSKFACFHHQHNADNRHFELGNQSEILVFDLWDVEVSRDSEIISKLDICISKVFLRLIN
jgi:hypothetical protein